ncbi:MAG TPA: DNA polymerase IV [Methylomirabilota bacterium]|nr:DNA polymerase IV [Methylomirabilota bacterium]
MFRVIFHLDMDAFYASVEQRDNPALAGKPVIVGSPPTQRGVVAACSYEARKFGVRSAMPSVTAGRLCPSGIFVRPRIESYKAESREIMAIIREMGGELIEQVSVDEAYIDLSERAQGETHDAALESLLPLAREMKQAIRNRRQLTATIGVAPNKLLAKLASDFKKPDGLTLVRESAKVTFLQPLPIRALHGVGAVTERALHSAGLMTIGDLQKHRGELRSLVGSWGPELKRFAMGEDNRPVETGDEIKSISSENTFLKDTEDRPTLRRCLKEQAGEIAAKLQKRRLSAFTVQVKVRYSDFTTLTRQLSLEDPLGSSADIYRLACFLLAREKLVSRPIRLIGIGVSGLVETQIRQLHLAI